MLFEEDSDLPAFVFVLAGAVLLVVVLAGAEVFVVVSLDLLTVPLLFDAAGLAVALSELVVVCLREAAASFPEVLFVLVFTVVGLSDLLIVPVLLMVLVSLLVLVRVFVLPVLRSPDCVDTDFLPSLVVVLVLFDLGSVPVRVLL